MLINIILLVVGFVILIKGADFFVDGASSVASNFKVSKMLIGLTIVAFGTSAPEFAVSVKSLLSGSGDIVLGNVIGSNILNILLILGASSMFHALNVKNNTVKKELPITMLVTTLFAVLLSDHIFDNKLVNSFTRGDGIAFGTSAPEFAVSVKSLLSGSGDIVLGNVIGSNILNILLILGASSMFHALNVKNNTVKKELPITMLVTTLFAVLLSDHIFDNKLVNSFTRGDGIVILLFFSVFLYYLISMSRKKIDVDQDEKPTMSLSKSFIWTIGGIVAIVLGSNAVVDSATYLAKAMGVSERLISLTIIALGTSLPELVTSITATRKGEYDIAIGNVVGSNVFNVGVVIGLPVAILGGIGKIAFSYIDLLVMIVSAILLFIFSYGDYKISKKEGFFFLLLFVVYYTYVIIA